jgi:hypothetical protein
MISATPLKFAIWPNPPAKLPCRWTISACLSSSACACAWRGARRQHSAAPGPSRCALASWCAPVPPPERRSAPPCWRSKDQTRLFYCCSRKATVPLGKPWPPNAPSGLMAISRTGASSSPGTPGVVPSGGYAPETPKRTVVQVARAPGAALMGGGGGDVIPALPTPARRDS